ncbi:anti-sigma factor [Gordonia sp. ABSL49_1]|uniref:anti-sigma factor n=1 Tax=Gordonia sp. ABSL49_1 TaxID=2920941 RepID=UPI001F117F4F|nr:anti-sigma factor [Gordonia sp. ABSL49_1]MCH5641217.1 anti-sigma factor [Gordonia sp. ABSL49_1]
MAEQQASSAGVGVIDEITRSADVPVVLSVRAHRTTLPIIRALVEHVMLLDDWTIDDVADLKLGVDEICGQLIEGARPAERIEVALTTGPQGLVVTMEAPVVSGFALETDGFGWRVVETVTDARHWAHVGAGPAQLLMVRVARRRA